MSISPEVPGEREIEAYLDVVTGPFEDPEIDYKGAVLVGDPQAVTQTEE